MFHTKKIILVSRYRMLLSPQTEGTVGGEQEWFDRDYCLVSSEHVLGQWESGTCVKDIFKSPSQWNTYFCTLQVNFYYVQSDSDIEILTDVPRPQSDLNSRPEWEN